MAGFVYLDESGDTGFKFNQGSSQYFVVTILLIEDPLPLSHAIDDLRKVLHFDERHEFKFTNSKDSIRRDFLRILVRHEVLVRALVINKPQVTQPHMRNTETFYNYLVKMLLKRDNGRLDNTTLILDERQKSRKSKQGVTTYLRRQLNEGGEEVRKLGKVRYHESHRDNLLQAVDMASGAINWNYARNEPSYLRILRVKIDDLWEFEPGETQ